MRAKFYILNEKGSMMEVDHRQWYRWFKTGRGDYCRMVTPVWPYILESEFVGSPGTMWRTFVRKEGAVVDLKVHETKVQAEMFHADFGGEL